MKSTTTTTTTVSFAVVTASLTGLGLDSDLFVARNAMQIGRPMSW
jgi:hypothetical protein